MAKERVRKLEFRVTPSEKQLIMNAAKDSGLRYADYMRSKLLKTAARSPSNNVEA